MASGRVRLHYQQYDKSIMKLIKIYFDGGTRPTNPGNGYGSYEIVSDTINHKISCREFGSPLSNNQAEYLSLIHALSWLVHQIDDMDTHLRIYSDSKLVVMQIQGSWKVKCIHIKEMVQEARELLGCFNKWEIYWSPRKNNVERFGH